VATTVQVATPARTRSLLALWHLLSLDAPSVAAGWVWFIARSQHVPLPIASPIAMALAVWMLYAADRLLDTRKLNQLCAGPNGEFEERHFFHHRHRRFFLIGIAASAIALTALLPHLDPAAIRLYLIEGALLLAWLAVLHATHSAHRLPKEIAVGLFFSAAVFIPTVAREPGLRAALLPLALLFAALCSTNCLFIYAWEHEGLATHTRMPHVTTRVAIRRMPAIATGLSMAALALVLVDSPANKVISSACLLSLGVLLALHLRRHRISRDTLRAAADLALLTPLLMMPFL
jgi:hypothetical protein